MARPRKQIDPDQVRRLAMINCTMVEIAAVVGCSVDTIERRFADVVKEGHEQGKSSLKRMMWESCQKGNVSMMIFLSKQMLGYSDKVEQKVDTIVNGEPLTKERIEEALRKDPASGSQSS